MSALECGSLLLGAALPAWGTLLLLFLSIVLLIWSLQGPIIEYFAKRAEAAEKVRRRLYRDTPLPLSIYGQPLIALATFLVLGFSASWVTAVIMAFVVYAAIGGMTKGAVKRVTDQFEQQLPGALMDMANSAKAGMTLPQAVGTVAEDSLPPISLEFDQVLRDYGHGRSIEQAFDDARERIQSRNFDLAIRAFRVGVERGGNVAEVFEQIAASIREIWRLEEHIKSVTSAGRSSARFMMAMPVIFFGLGFMMDSEGMGLMVTDPIGLTILSVIVLIMLFCRMTINRILNVDV